MLWNTETACEWKDHSLVQNKGVAALSAGDSNVQPSGGYSKENLMQQEIFLHKKSGHLSKAVCILGCKNFRVFLLFIISLSDPTPSGN